MLLFQCAAAMLGRGIRTASITEEIAMPAMLSSPYVLPILMLLGSNVFMTLAWYGHLRFKEVPLAGVIFAAWASLSWSIAWRYRPTAGAARSIRRRN